MLLDLMSLLSLSLLLARERHPERWDEVARGKVVRLEIEGGEGEMGNGGGFSLSTAAVPAPLAEPGRTRGVMSRVG